MAVNARKYANIYKTSSISPLIMACTITITNILVI